MAFKTTINHDWQGWRRGPDINLIFKKRTKTIVGMWRSQPERDAALASMKENFPGQYDGAVAWCRLDGDELAVEFFPGLHRLPECYAKTFEEMARKAATEAKSGI